MLEENGRREIDVKRYARFEKVCRHSERSHGDLDYFLGLDSRRFNRRFTFAQGCDAQQGCRPSKDETVLIERQNRMLLDGLCSRIENPRIVLLDCSLEYKKGESQTALEFSGEPDFTYVHLSVASLTLFDSSLAGCCNWKRRVSTPCVKTSLR